MTAVKISCDIVGRTVIKINSAVRFSIYSAVWSIIRPFGFLFIRPSGFGLMYKFVNWEVSYYQFK